MHALARVTAATVLAVLLLSACSFTASAEDKYWAVFNKSDTPMTFSQGSEAITSIGYVVCSQIESYGRTEGFLIALRALEDIGVPELEAGILIGAAQMHLCPNAGR